MSRLQTSLKRRRRRRPGPLFFFLSRDQFAIETILGNPSVCHAVDVPESAKSALREQSKHVRDGASEDLSVWDTVSPLHNYPGRVSGCACGMR